MEEKFQIEILPCTDLFYIYESGSSSLDLISLAGHLGFPNSLLGRAWFESQHLVMGEGGEDKEKEEEGAVVAFQGNLSKGKSYIQTVILWP